MLILAAEDYTGTPSCPSTRTPTGPHYLDALHGRRSTAHGIGYDVYDVDADGRTAPDPLGVLSHYEAVVWYTGDDL